MQFATYASTQVSLIYEQLHSTPDGLPEADVVVFQKKYGPNKIAEKEVQWWELLLLQFKSPFVYLLLAAAGVALYMGENIDALFIVFFVLLSAFLGFIQEYHSNRSIQLLKKFLTTHVKVKRGGSVALKESQELVPGDICILEPGDSVPADLRFITADNILIDESILTGESTPVSKINTAIQNVSAIHEANNIGFSGTTVLQGTATGIVFAIGRSTEMGDIAKLMIETKSKGVFEKGIAKFSSFILKMIIVTLVIIFIASVLTKGAAHIPEILLFSIALAVSVIPEGLPAVATLSFSKGALNLARKHVVVKRLSAVEDLGSIEILCTDKTGTITENKLIVSQIQSADENACLLHAALSATSVMDEESKMSNSFDLAVWQKLSPTERKKVSACKRLSEIPFDPERKIQSTLMQIDDTVELIIKGAPETVLSLCRDVSSNQKQEILSFIKKEGLAGNRTVAVAHKKWHGDTTTYAHSAENDLEYSGTLSFIDPIKESTPKALSRAHELGVKIKILTGDGREVAGAVAQKVGLIKNADEVITGDELEHMAPDDMHEAIEKYSVFARVSPKQKYHIIESLQTKHVVGFLGDGINDAPALKLASVALAVNTSCDIARDAADIVLLNSSLAVIIDGIKGGREIFTNMVKYLKTTLISNFGNFFSVAVASFLVPFLPMLPVQILLLNLLTDFPMIAISMDTVDSSELRSPRVYQVKEIIIMSVIFGLVSSIFDFVFFFLFYKHAPAVLQTNWFIGSVLTELALIYSIRTKKVFWRGTSPAKILSILCIIPVLIALLLPFVSYGHVIFSFVTPKIYDLFLILVVAALYFAATEILKPIYYKKLSFKFKN